MNDNLKGTVERARYMVENPSAWDTFDQRGSDTIRDLLDALTPAGDEAYANGDALPPGTIDLRAAETNEALAWLDAQQSEGAIKAASVIRAMRVAYRDQGQLAWKQYVGVARAALTASRSYSDETAWLVEENTAGHIHWIKLATKEWPRTKVSIRRARMNSGLDREITEYLTPVVRVKDAGEALQFARKQDAEAFIALFDRFLLNATATEHQWPAPSLTIDEGVTQADREQAVRILSHLNRKGVFNTPKDAEMIIETFRAHRVAALSKVKGDTDGR